MTESSIPACAAAVAAPIWKLCPEYLAVGMPACVSACQTAETNLSQVRGFPSLKMKRGPSDEGRTAI